MRLSTLLDSQTERRWHVRTCVAEESCPISVDIVPLSCVLVNFKNFKFDRVKISVGIPFVNSLLAVAPTLLPKFNNSNVSTFPISDGIVPTRLFSSRASCLTLWEFHVHDKPTQMQTLLLCSHPLLSVQLSPAVEK